MQRLCTRILGAFPPWPLVRHRLRSPPLPVMTIPRAGGKQLIRGLRGNRRRQHKTVLCSRCPSIMLPRSKETVS